MDNREIEFINVEDICNDFDSLYKEGGYNHTYYLSDYHHYDKEFTGYKSASEIVTDDMMTIGAELEVEVPNDVSRDEICTHLRSILNCFTTTDGSLMHGIEIVSNPMTFKAWELRKDILGKMFKKLIDMGVTSDEAGTCGLHFHVNRSSLGETKEKQSEVINRIDLLLENFKDEITIFSRRGGRRSYCNFLSDAVCFDSNDSIYDTNTIKKKKIEVGKYQALNVLPTYTIEFRIFKGSLNIQTFYASLQLVKNIIEVCKDGSYRGITWHQLISKNNYDELIKYNALRNIKSNIRLKDWTERIAQQRIIEDRKMKRLATKNAKRFKDFEKYVKANYITIIKLMDLCRGERDIYNIMRRLSSNSFFNHIEIVSKLQEFARLRDDIGYVSKYFYECLDGSTLKFYTDANFSEYFDKFVNLIEDLKGVL